MSDYIQCSAPPDGWVCYLQAGHSGSCPTYEENVRPSSQKITCPKCSHNFTWGDSKISEEQKAILVLVDHQFSVRSIGRMMNLHPESVRYRVTEAKRHKMVTPKPFLADNKEHIDHE